MLATGDGMAINTVTGEISNQSALAWGAPGAGRQGGAGGFFGQLSAAAGQVGEQMSGYARLHGSACCGFG